MDHQLRQELAPQLNALAEIAEVLRDKSEGNVNVQRFLNVTRDLLNEVQQEEPSQNSGATTPAPSSNAQCDVLYIEDNPINFEVVKLFLGTQRGLNVLQAIHGETGIGFAQTRRPKLILLDLNLPDIHGSEVISRLQKDPLTSKIPVVVLSADATSSQIERLLVLGAKNYLTKPFEAKPFLAVIDEVLAETQDASGSHGASSSEFTPP
jgi:CheY-like chemotaxis protein